MNAPGALRMGINEAKVNFFAVDTVMRKAEQGERRAMRHFGGYVRKVAMSSMKQRKSWSAPGHPPAAHIGRIRGLLYFAYEPARGSVVVGPILCAKGSGRGGTERGAVTTPELLEHGGVIRRQVNARRLMSIWRARHDNPRAAAMFKALAPHRDEAVFMRYEPRPFMEPAFRAAQWHLPVFWKDSIRA